MTPEIARARAKKILGLYYRIFIFIIVNLFLYYIDFKDNNQINWAYFVTFGWGIGLGFNIFSIILGGDIEDKLTAKILGK